MAYEHFDVKTDGLSLKMIREKFNCGQATAVAIRRRGYVTRKIKRQNPLDDMGRFDVGMAYSAAEVVFWRKFRNLFNNSLDHLDDMRQMAVLRMIERSGDIEEFDNKFSGMCGIATFEMHNYLKSMNIRATNMVGKICSFDDNVKGGGVYA